MKRIAALSKKVTLETKMRDAASKLSSSLSKRSSLKTDQFMEANAKVEAAHRELHKMTERAAVVDRRLLEHRAAVLAHTVRVVEERARAAGQVSSTETGDSSDNGTAGTTISGELSPVSTAPTSLSVSSRSKFEGPHLFAGHSEAVVPTLPRGLPTWKELDTLQEQLAAATEASEVAKQQAAEHLREVSMLQLGQLELESRASVEAQRAEEADARLEKELAQLRAIGSELDELRAAKQAIEREHDALLTTMRQRGAAMAALGLNGASRGSLAPSQSQSQAHLTGDTWDEDFTALRDELLQSRLANASESRHTSEELESGRSTLSEVARSLNIMLPGSVSTVPALAAALAAHVGSLQARLDEHARVQSGWDAERSRLENEIRRAMDSQQRLITDVDEARRDREELRSQLRVSSIVLIITLSPRSYLIPSSGVTYCQPDCSSTITQHESSRRCWWRTRSCLSLVTNSLDAIALDRSACQAQCQEQLAQVAQIAGQR